MSATTCPHGDHPACCIECLETTPPKPKPQERADSWPWRSKLTTRCPKCSGHIEQGEPIVHTTYDRWVHAECVPAVTS